MKLVSCSSSRLCVFISDRVAVRLGFLEIALKIDSRKLLSALFACARGVAMKTTNLTKESCAGLLSALDKLSAQVPVQAPRIQSRVHVIVSRIPG